MTLILVPFLWILFIVNPKLMTFLVALTFTAAHVGALMVLDGTAVKTGWALATLGASGFIFCMTIYPAERIDI